MSASAVVTRSADRDLDDRDLVAAVRAGDKRAFGLLYARYQARIASFVRSRVRDHARAEDITQEVFVSALRAIPRTDREIVFGPWIYKIAENACIDASRRARTAPKEVPFEAPDATDGGDRGRLVARSATPDAVVEGKVALHNLCGAFGGLRREYHDILVLREFDGLSYREIGERLGMSRPAVESALCRARKQLSEEYGELASGERCRRVQRIVDAHGVRAPGLRDQRRMARHLAHCQSCRRYAHLAGAPVAERSLGARIAALVPLPAFLRRRWSEEDAVGLLGQQTGSVAQWSANVATVLDPATASSWAKAVATAATVAVAGIGTGAAVTGSSPLDQLREPGRPFAPPGLVVGGARSQALAPPSLDVLVHEPSGTLPASGVPGAAPVRVAPDATLAPAPAATAAPRDRRPASATDDPRPAGAPSASGEASREQRPPSASSGADAGGDVAGHAAGTAGGAVSTTNAAVSGAVPAVPVSAVPLDAGVRPVTGAVETASQGVPTTLGSTVGAPPPDAVVGSVTPTVSDTVTNTTTALTSLGR